MQEKDILLMDVTRKKDRKRERKRKERKKEERE